MKFNILAAAIGAIAALGLGASAQATQFVVNGDFTAGPNPVLVNNSNTPGWTSSHYDFVFADAEQNATCCTVSFWDANNGGANSWNGLAAHGGDFAAMDGDYDTGPLSQTITGLTIGHTYTLSFSYAFGQQTRFNGATIQSLTASLGNNYSFNSGNVDVANHAFTGWTDVSTTITATSASETLSFLAHGNLPVPPFAFVSNVSLTGGVPEPAAWALMLIGLGALGVAARRRRSVSAV